MWRFGYTKAVRTRDGWPSLLLMTLDTDVVTITGAWLQAGECANDLLVQEYTLVRMFKGDGGVADRVPIVAAKKHATLRGHKLGA